MPLHGLSYARPHSSLGLPSVDLLGLLDLLLQGVDDPMLDQVRSGEAIGPGGLP